jgi:hypothetical protein
VNLGKGTLPGQIARVRARTINFCHESCNDPPQGHTPRERVPGARRTHLTPRHTTPDPPPEKPPRARHPRIHDGAFSAMDLTARHPRTGDLLSTVKVMVQTLAVVAAGEDRRRTHRVPGGPVHRRPGPRARRQPGRHPHGRRRPHARAHHRRHRGRPAPELPVTLDIPGKASGFLRTARLEPTERAALDHGVTVRRGQGYTLRGSAKPSVHRQFLARCQPLDGARVPWRSRHSARPAASTRTASTPSRATFRSESSGGRAPSRCGPQSLSVSYGCRQETRCRPRSGP